MQQKLFDGIGKLEHIRKDSAVFHTDAQVSTVNTMDDSVLGIVRENEGCRLTALFNFSEFDKTIYLDEWNAGGTDLITGQKQEGNSVQMPGYGVCWLLKDKN